MTTVRKIAFLFPGQGSQAVGMGVDIAGRSPEASAVFDQASQVLGWDLLEACRLGPEERLRQTDIAQPALYAAGYAAFAALRAAGREPDAVAGHSIGEYAALAAAGVFGFGEGMALVRERGRLMQEAALAHPGGMLAVLGISREQALELCRQAQVAGLCVPVNFNSPEQVVLAGEKVAIEKAASLATALGAKRAIPLNVSGAFHSPLMKEAAERMKETLEKIEFRDPTVPVVMNVDGALRTDKRGVQEALARQLDSPVEWTKAVEALQVFGCTLFVECGPGRVLGGLVKRMDRTLQVFTMEDYLCDSKTK